MRHLRLQLGLLVTFFTLNVARAAEHCAGSASSAEALALPAASFRTVAILREIDRRPSEAAIELHTILRNVARRHNAHQPVSGNAAREQIITEVLRKLVPEDQKFLPLAIAEAIWDAQLNFRYPLAEPAFERLAMKALLPQFESLTQTYIDPHDVVLSMKMVDDIIDGAQRVDPEKIHEIIWRPRRDADKVNIATAVRRVAEAVIRGMGDFIQQNPGEPKPASRDKMIDAGVKRGMAALGRYDVGAFDSGGVPAMFARAA